jgi:DNA-binding beta-propeller fold protein YncE
VPDSTGGFDFIKIDAARNRLLADHTGNSSLDVFDLSDGKLLKHVPTGKAQDVDIDEEAGTYLVSVSKEQKIAVVDAAKLEVIKEIKLEGPADAIVFNPKKHELYVGHDDGKNLWVVDTRENKVAASIAIAEAPEVAVYDAASDRVFQNIKSDATVLVIDPATRAIKETWSTAPATGPHGLAYNPVTAHLFCAGANSKLSVVDARTGKNAGSVDIAKGVDQIAFDPATQRVYCACSSGKISIVQDSATGATSLGDVDSAHGARSIAWDVKGHAVWVAYADDKGSYIQRFQAK